MQKMITLFVMACLGLNAAEIELSWSIPANSAPQYSMFKIYATDSLNPPIQWKLVGNIVGVVVDPAQIDWSARLPLLNGIQFFRCGLSNAVTTLPNVEQPIRLNIALK